MNKRLIGVALFVIVSVSAKADVGEVPLPEGYAPVKGIEAFGTEYIDTHYTNQADDVITVDAYIPLPQPAAYISLFGTYDSATKAYFKFDTCTDAAKGKPRYVRSAGGILAGSFGAKESFYNQRITLVCGQTMAAQWTAADGSDSETLGSIWGPNPPFVGATCSMAIFAYNSGTSLQSPCAAKLYSLKITGPDGTVRRDFVPCLNPEGEAGLWERITGRFLGNIGTGALREVRELPEECARLDYIEATGKQFIDAHFTNQATDVIRADVYIPFPSKTYLSLFGTYDESTKRYFKFDTSTDASAGSPRFVRSSNGSLAAGFGNSLKFYDQWIKLECNQTTAAKFRAADGSTGTFTFKHEYGPSASCYDGASCSMAIFGYNSGSRITQLCSARLRSFTVSSGNKVARDFVPCDRDGVIGLWDLAEGKFYPNNGSDEFAHNVIKATVEGSVLRVSEGVLTTADVAAYSVEKAGTGTVNANAVKRFPADLTVSQGVLSLANGTVEQHVVAGKVTMAGGTILRIDMTDGGCDELAVGSFDCTSASASTPIVISANPTKDLVVRNKVIYRVISGMNLRRKDVSRFNLTGVDAAKLEIIGGDLYIVNENWTAGFKIYVR